MADEPPSIRQIYVIASQCDSSRRQFYAFTGKFVTSVQILWVEEAPSDEKECRILVGEVAKADSELLLKIYEIPPWTALKSLKDIAVRWNRGIEKAAEPLLRYITDSYRKPFLLPNGYTGLRSRR